MQLPLHVVRERLDGIATAASTCLDALPIHVITAPVVRLDVERDRTALRDTVASLRPRLLVLDPFVRLHRVNENSSDEVAPLLASLRELQRRYDVAVLGAGAVGLIIVALYMILYYRALGIVVVFGFGVWGALMYTVVCWLGATQGLALTLAGVTGMIMSIGVTADSYIVFFERLKDDVRAGRTLRSSTERSFKRAFRTILAANMTSFIGAAVLWWLTVGWVSSR